MRVTNEGGPLHERALDVLAALLAEQAKVARVEASLAAARQRLADLEERYRQLGQPLPAPVDAWPALPAERARRGRELDDGGPSLRARILDQMEARPNQVLTPAMLAPLVRARSRDAVRNALLVLAAKGQIEKVGQGQYRALRGRW